MEKRFIVDQEKEEREGAENGEDQEFDVCGRDCESFSENIKSFQLLIPDDEVAFYLHDFTSKGWT